ncbi:DNA-3-methyladenine glycosylase [Clostridium mediterraneense]|uniref:DNA-3-methyladenine glycosylase n=1 Tax=Clostridium mediterraneense TaxID=1805472 RepID=UPI000831E4BA|nr:DNA-3-methyladenine glycosylase [Clostridium mediterraneense]
MKDATLLEKDFFKGDCLSLSKELLGKILVRNINGLELKGRIVETEAYIGKIDKASHAYNGRRTARTETLYAEGGVTYVYLIYGMYHCFNVITGKKDEAEGVLIRALEPLNEFDYLSEKRFNKNNYSELNKSQRLGLTNGPGKLCKAFSIDKSLINNPLYIKEELYIVDDNFKDFEIVETTRIGIDYAEEAKYFPWRFYIKDNPYVSKK